MNSGVFFLSAMGRICISLIFIIMACATVYDWQASEIELVTSLTQWQSYTGYASMLGDLFGQVVSMVPILMGIGVFLQLLGGVFLFFGVQIRMGAFCLLIYLIPITIIHHPFWFLMGSVQAMALVLFLKNLAVIGGLLVVLAFGRGNRLGIKREK